MRRLTRLKLNAQVSEEAAEWFTEFRSGEPDDSQRAAFDGWVRASPEHLRAFLEIAAIWNEAADLDPADWINVEDLEASIHDHAIVIPLNAAASPQQHSRQITQAASAQQPADRPLRQTRRPSVAIAASVFIAIAAGLSMYLWYPRQPVYSTAIGEQRSLRLVDGSTVELNSRSRIRIRFSEHERNVDLIEGQVLFRVAKDRARPFVVQAGNIRVQAVGTQFDVYRKHLGTVITVVEGRVAVDGSAAHSATSWHADSSRNETQHLPIAPPVYLSAGEQLTSSPDTARPPIRTDVGAVTAWTQHKLVFDSATLAEVAEEFNRYSAKRLVVEETGAHPLRLSGVFATDPEFLLNYLQQRPDIRIRESDREIQIQRLE